MVGVGGESGDGVAAPPEALIKWRRDLATKFQYYLDRSVPHTSRRWLGTLVVAAIYFLRVYFVKGFYVVSYGLATYVLNMLIGFLSPKVDPEFEGLDGVSFPNKESDESKPRFIRRLPEFKFWYSVTKAFVVSFLLTFVSVLDVPVFWPILLSYWLFLVFVTTWRQLVHMFRYKYNPFSTQKLRNEKKDSSVAETQSIASREINAAHG